MNRFFCCFLILLLSLGYLQANTLNKDGQLNQKISQINLFAESIYNSKESNNEQTLSYQRSKLLKDRSFISKHIAELNTRLERVDSILRFIDGKYQNEQFSEFINERVENNKYLNVKLKEYTRKRALILNELVLLKEVHLNIENALKHISSIRTYLRNQFRFEKNNVLWKPQAWYFAFHTFWDNITQVIKDIVFFLILLGMYFFSKTVFSLDKCLFQNPKLKTKKKLFKATRKLNGIYFLLFSAVLYPLVVLGIGHLFRYLEIISSDTYYVMTIVSQVVGIYAFLIFILENFAQIYISKLLKTLLIIAYSTFGMIMYIFRSNLVSFTRGSLTSILSREEALILVFFFMLVMLIPIVCIFIKLGKVTTSNKSDIRVVHLVKYFMLGTLLFSILMMTLGGYPNFGMSAGFDMYQILYGSLYIYVFYKVSVIIVDMLMCNKTRVVVIRSLAETAIGGVKRAGVRYWIKNLIFILSIVMFLIILPLCLNIQSERLEDIWNTFFYEGGDILGLQLIPLITLMKSILVIIVAFFIYRFIILVANKRVFPYTNMDLGTREAILSIIKYIFVVIAIFLFIKSLGISNTAITFIISGLSVGLGFAMQDLVKNFFAGLVMLIERPVKIGDWVNVNNEIGVVKKISIRATEVLTFDNNSLIVPNNVMITNVVSNETLDPTSRLVLPLRISYAQNPQRVIEVCKQVVESEKRIFKTPAPEFLLTSYDEYSMEIAVRAYCLRTVKIYLLSDLRLKILDALKDNNIRIEYPKLDIYIKDTDK